MHSSYLFPGGEGAPLPKPKLYLLIAPTQGLTFRSWIRHCLVSTLSIVFFRNAAPMKSEKISTKFCAILMGWVMAETS